MCVTESVFVLHCKDFAKQEKQHGKQKGAPRREPENAISLLSLPMHPTSYDAHVTLSLDLPGNEIPPQKSIGTKTTRDNSFCEWVQLAF